MGDANRCVQNLDKKKFLGKTLLMTKKFHIDQLKWFKNTSRLKTSHRKKNILVHSTTPQCTRKHHQPDFFHPYLMTQIKWFLEVLTNFENLLCNLSNRS